MISALAPQILLATVSHLPPRHCTVARTQLLRSLQSSQPWSYPRFGARKSMTVPLAVGHAEPVAQPIPHAAPTTVHGSPTGPPEMETPPASVAAKALQALWWSVQPYLKRGTTSLGSVVTTGNGSTVLVARRPGPPSTSAAGVDSTSKEDDTNIAAVVHFNTATRALVVSFTGTLRLVKAVLGSGAEEASFACLEQAAPKAKVVRAVGEELEAVLGPVSDLAGGAAPNRAASVFGAIGLVLAGAQPLSVHCTGYGAGGALATLAIVRLGLRFPTADTSCIVFGSPNVGNPEFVAAFNKVCGHSFRVEHAGDPLTNAPSGASWTFPAAFDLPIGQKGAEASWDNHSLARYFEGLLGKARTQDLPYNAPGVYLLVKPKTIKQVNAAARNEQKDKPWPIDDYFVPGMEAGQDTAPLRSPYDTKVELGDGVHCSVGELFQPQSKVWRELAEVLGAELGGTGTVQSVASELDFKPSAQPQRARFVAQRFVPAVGSDTASGAAAGIAAAATAANKANSDLEPLPYLDYKPPADLAKQAHACDMLAAARIPVPLLFSTAAYRESPSAKLVAGSNEPVLCPPPPGLSDPFAAGIEALVNSGHVLGYRLIDDTEFQMYESGEWSPIGKVKTGNKTDTQAYVVLLADGTAVFAFRGTAQAVDWLTNFDFASRALDGNNTAEDERGKVHQGFMRGFCAMAYRGQPGISPAHGSPKEGAVAARNLAGVLQELMESHPAIRDSPLVQSGLGPARVVVCGHSLGGALATLGAAWAAEQYPLAPVSLYTFGQPRVGDERFVSHLEAVTSFCTRVVHRSDAVPLAPLNLMGYSHYYPVGFLAASTLERLSMFLPWPSQFRLEHTPDRRWLTVLPTLARGVSDHMLDGYTEAMERALKAFGFTKTR